MEHEYTPEDLQLIKHEIYINKLQDNFSESDLDRISPKHLVKLYLEMNETDLCLSDFQKHFISWYGILPTKSGKFYRASRSVDHGYFGWGMINMGEYDKLLWIPDNHLDYHRARLASGLIAITEVDRSTTIYAG